MKNKITAITIGLHFSWRAPPLKARAIVIHSGFCFGNKSAIKKVLNFKRVMDNIDIFNREPRFRADALILYRGALPVETPYNLKDWSSFITKFLKGV